MSAEDLINQSERLVIGYVSGEHYSQYEEGVLAGADPEARPAWGKRSVRVVVVDNIKGEVSAKIVDDVVVACGDRTPRTFERTVVRISSSGLANVVSWPTEEALRAAAAKID